MKRGFLALAVVLELLGACNQGGAPPSGGTSTSSTQPAGAQQSLGNVMAEVARRFEIAGRAAVANRYELAEFEAGEIGELFETDVPSAAFPKEGPTAHIPVMAKAFLENNTPALQKAAAARDPAAFATAFERAAAVCNACHKAAEKGFIQVPSVPGKGVPDLEPLRAEERDH